MEGFVSLDHKVEVSMAPTLFSMFLPRQFVDVLLVQRSHTLHTVSLKVL